MKTTFFFLFLLIGISACNLNNSPENNNSIKLDSLKIGRDTVSAVKEFQGLYKPHYSTFINCEDGKTYVLKNNTALDSIYQTILPNAYTDEAVYVKMIASIDRDQTDILNVKIGSELHVEQKNHKNTCIPYEYWCMGTEPFWILEISKLEDLIDLYEPMEQKTSHFVYSAPETKNGNIIYTSSDGMYKIVVTIKKEKCNGAIDKQYEYSAEIQLNEKKFRGCALKYGENI